MGNFKRTSLFIILIMTIFFSKYIGINYTPTILKVIIMIIAPIILIWMASRYSKPGKDKKYRIIGFSAGGFWIYITIITSFIQQNYNSFYQKYFYILRYASFVSLIIAFIVTGICFQKVKAEEEKYL